MPDSVPLGALPAVGDVVAGKYRIDRMLAEGGMGVVFEAMHLHLDERVAIKFLRSDFAGPLQGEAAGRFLREARASAKIRSEHVVRVHDVGTLDVGAPYIVMELLKGYDLEKLVERSGVLSLEKAIDYILQACEALAEAHAIGIVHRDLKPANLFLTHRADGSPCIKVLDFGISKFKDRGSGPDMGITKTHSVMGSPRYMSPEQMRSSKDVDARADVWAIGIILYELFAGTVPFDGESMPQICAAILEETPKSLRSLRPEVPAELETIVKCCLSKKAADRYPNIAPLATALAAFGSADARASAERVGRVLRASMDTPPREFMVSSVDSGPIPSVRHSRVSEPEPEPVEASSTAVAWTGLDLPLYKRRRAATFAAFGLGAILLVIGAMTLLFRSPTNSASAPPASVSKEVLAVATTTDTPNTAIASAVASTTLPANQIAPMTTATAAIAATTKRVAPPRANARASATPHSPSSPPSTQNDMWGERK